MTSQRSHDGAPVATPGHAVLTARIGSFSFHGEHGSCAAGRRGQRPSRHADRRPGRLRQRQDHPGEAAGRLAPARTVRSAHAAPWRWRGRAAGVPRRPGRSPDQSRPPGRAGWATSRRMRPPCSPLCAPRWPRSWPLASRTGAPPRPDMLRAGRPHRGADRAGRTPGAGTRPRFPAANCAGWPSPALSSTEPGVLVLDEPLASLDAAGVIQVRSLVDGLTRRRYRRRGPEPEQPTPWPAAPRTGSCSTAAPPPPAARPGG